MSSCECPSANCGNPAHQPNELCEHGVLEILGDPNTRLCSPCAAAADANRTGRISEVKSLVDFDQHLAEITQEGYELKVRQMMLGDGDSAERARNAARILAIVSETSRIQNVAALRECLINRFPPTATLLPKAGSAWNFSVSDNGRARIFGISDEALAVLENQKRLLSAGEFETKMRIHGMFDRISYDPVLIMADMLN